MQDMTGIVDAYLAAWNETDAAARDALVARAFADGARYLDPKLEGEGHAGIAAMIVGAQALFPGHRFRRAGAVEAHHDRLRFRWELTDWDGQVALRGTDVAVVAPDGRLREVTGFFDA